MTRYDGRLVPPQLAPALYRFLAAFPALLERFQFRRVGRSGVKLARPIFYEQVKFELTELVLFRAADCQ